MGSGTVPVPIALACADKASVAHIDWYEEFLPFLRRNSALAEYHGIGVYIIVYSRELLLNMEVHTLDDLVHHCLSVEHGELLDYLHIVDVLLKELSLAVGKVLGNVCGLGICQLFQLRLYLLFPALCLQPCNELRSLLVAALVKSPVSLVLVELCGLNAEVA